MQTLFSSVQLFNSLGIPRESHNQTRMLPVLQQATIHTTGKPSVQFSCSISQESLRNPLGIPEESLRNPCLNCRIILLALELVVLPASWLFSWPSKSIGFLDNWPGEQLTGRENNQLAGRTTNSPTPHPPPPMVPKGVKVAKMSEN